MARIAFAKFEGLGNDFVVMETASGEPLSPDVVSRLCDRHFGVGADGVLLVGPPGSPGARASMIVQNADGSRPEMCGNGIRCVARYLAEKTGQPAELRVDTDAGSLHCRFVGDEVEVQMGALTDLGTVEIGALGRAHRFARVSIGNPHAVTFERYDSAEIDSIGPRVSVDAAFPGGTNVEFARLLADGSIEVAVWERGVGRTLACGTGACATAFAACLSRRRSFDELIEVKLPGGSLHVSIDQKSRVATMRGPARRVFTGEVTLP